MRTAIYSPKSWHARLYLRKYNDFDTDICTYSRRVFTIVFIRVLLAGLVVSMSLSAFWYLNVKLHLGFDLVIYLNEQGLLVSNSLWVHVVFFVGVMGWIATVAVLGSWVVVLGITTYFNRKSRQRVVRDTFMKDSRDSFFKRMCFRVTFKE